MKLLPAILITAVFASGSVIAQNAVVVEPLLSTDIAWDGQALPNHVQIVKTTIKAGQIKPVHQHNNLFCGYLLKGELTITKVGGNGDAAIFVPGDAFCELIDQNHFGRAGKESDVEVITFEVKR